MHPIDYFSLLTSKDIYLLPTGIGFVLLFFYFLDTYEFKVLIRPKRPKK